MKKTFYVLLASCFLFSSCMISTIYSKKEFKEKIPCYVDKGVFIPYIFFEDNKNSIPLILWKFDFINKKAKEILICFTNGKSHFPENKSVDVKSVKIKYKNGKEFTTVSKKIETESYYHIVDNSSKESSFGYPLGHAPEGTVGEYRIILTFDDIVKLTKADTLELQILITEDGETTEVTKVLHFDMEYKMQTETMVGAWIRSF